MRITAWALPLVALTVGGVCSSKTLSAEASDCNGQLFAAPQFDIPGTDTFIIAADLDGDSDDDIASASSAGVSVMLAQGNGTFSSAAIYSPNSDAEGIVAADVDQDGDLDLASAHAGNAPLYPSTVRIMLNAGDGMFTASASYAVDNQATVIIAADFNADGLSDLATANRQAGTVSILLNAGGGLFAPAVEFPVGPAPTTLAAADFNQDGFAELAVGSEANPTLTLLLNERAGFAPLTPVQLSGPSGWITTGDFNGDGDPDLAIATRIPSSNIGLVTLMFGDRGTSFQSPVTVIVDPFPVHLLARDLNADGQIDLAATGLFCQGVANEHCAAILFGHGDGNFDEPDYIVAGPTDPDASVIVAGQFNNDVWPDLAVITDASRELTLLLAEGQGQFAAAVVPEVEFHWTMFVLAADLDLDGDVDIASADDSEDHISIFLQGDGAFGPPSNYAVTDNPRSIAIGNLDDDGLPDLAIGNQNSFTLPILHGQGGGTFVAAQMSPVPSDGRSVAVGDLDGDGDDELARVRWSWDAVSLFLDEDDFTNPPFVDYSTDEGPNEVLIGDVDLDGDSDLVTINGLGHSASVLLNTGSGGFASATTYPTGGSGYGGLYGALGDVDNDGDLDIAAACCQSLNGHIALLINAGDGTFGESVSIAHVGGPSAVAIGDVNADGTADLVTADSEGHGVSVFLGQGGRDFSYQSSHAVSSAAIHLALADLNSDGFQDVVVGGAGGVSLMYNAGCIPADLDGDGHVGALDLAMLLASWGAGDSSADLNDDGIVGPADLALLLANWS